MNKFYTKKKTEIISFTAIFDHDIYESIANPGMRHRIIERHNDGHWYILGMEKLLGIRWYEEFEIIYACRHAVNWKEIRAKYFPRATLEKNIPTFHRLIKAARFSARNEVSSKQDAKILLNFIIVLCNRANKKLSHPFNLPDKLLKAVADRGNIEIIFEYAYKIIIDGDREINHQQLAGRMMDDINRFSRELVYIGKSDELDSWLKNH